MNLWEEDGFEGLSRSLRPSSATTLRSRTRSSPSGGPRRPTTGARGWRPHPRARAVDARRSKSSAPTVCAATSTRTSSSSFRRARRVDFLDAVRDEAVVAVREVRLGARRRVGDRDGQRVGVLPALVDPDVGARGARLEAAQRTDTGLARWRSAQLRPLHAPASVPAGRLAAVAACGSAASRRVPTGTPGWDGPVSDVPAARRRPGVTADRLQSFCADVLVALGAERDIAATVAESLVDADLRGIDSHGVHLLDLYVDRIGKRAHRPARRTPASSTTSDSVVHPRRRPRLRSAVRRSRRSTSAIERARLHGVASAIWCARRRTSVRSATTRAEPRSRRHRNGVPERSDHRPAVRVDHAGVLDEPVLVRGPDG